MLPCISLPETLYLADLGLRNGVSQVHPFQLGLLGCREPWIVHDCAEDEATLQMSNGALGVAQGPVAALGVARCISVPRCAQMCPVVRRGEAVCDPTWDVRKLQCAPASCRTDATPYAVFGLLWSLQESLRYAYNNRAIPMHIMHVKEIWREISRSVFQVRFPGHAYGGSQALQSGQVDAVQIVWGWRGDGCLCDSLPGFALYAESPTELLNFVLPIWGAILRSFLVDLWYVW